MKIVGIICEYDPFHLGHLRQLRLIRQRFGDEAAVVCVMSGNYVQRGEPAMWDKFTRAEAAVAGGADLVLELPITGVLQSAEGFARCGVEILDRFGAEVLCFGAECGDGEALMDAARRMQTEEYTAELRRQLEQGLSYGAARQRALGDNTALLSKPNNILGLEYCCAILARGSSMEPMAVRRGGDYHAAEADSQEPSATAVRALMPDGEWQSYVPAAHVFAGKPWYAVEFGERAVLARLRGMSDTEWQQTAHGSEGLWSKAMKAARREPTLRAVEEAVKSKRYPMTRIRRLLLCAYLGITETDLRRPVSYVRILAASERGFSLLRAAKKQARLPLVNPGEIPEDREFWRLETRASDLYTLFAAPGCETACAAEQAARINRKNNF